MRRKAGPARLFWGVGFYSLELKMTTADLIKLSIKENRTVTEYPATKEEYDSLLDGLLASSDGDVDTAEHSGAGYSGSESRGRTEVWSADGWRVDLVHPPA
jgi:hypothetical protein